MKIGHINTINFGYNRNYHENIQARLAKMGTTTPLANNLRSIDALLLVHVCSSRRFKSVQIYRFWFSQMLVISPPL